MLQKAWMLTVTSLRAVRVEPTQEVGIIIRGDIALALLGFVATGTCGKPKSEGDTNEQNHTDDDPHAQHARKSTQDESRRLTDVKRFPAWLSYTLLRLVFFIVPFAVLWAIGFQAWMAAIFAAVIALSLSIIFLSKFRNATSESIARVRDNKTPKPNVDEAAEDAL